MDWKKVTENVYMKIQCIVIRFQVILFDGNFSHQLFSRNGRSIEQLPVLLILLLLFQFSEFLCIIFCILHSSASIYLWSTCVNSAGSVSLPSISGQTNRCSTPLPIKLLTYCLFHGRTPFWYSFSLWSTPCHNFLEEDVDIWGYIFILKYL